MTHRVGSGAAEHDVEFGEAEDEAVGLVDEQYLDVVSEFLGEPRGDLQAAESGSQHQNSHFAVSALDDVVAHRPYENAAVIGNPRVSATPPPVAPASRPARKNVARQRADAP